MEDTNGTLGPSLLKLMVYFHYTLLKLFLADLFTLNLLIRFLILFNLKKFIAKFLKDFYLTKLNSLMTLNLDGHTLEILKVSFINQMKCFLIFLVLITIVFAIIFKD